MVINKNQDKQTIFFDKNKTRRKQLADGLEQHLNREYGVVLSDLNNKAKKSHKSAKRFFDKTGSMLLEHRQKPTRRRDGVSSDRQILRLLSVTYCMFLEKHCFPVKSLLCTGAAFLASSTSIETGSRVGCYPIGPFHLFPCAMPSLFK